MSANDKQVGGKHYGAEIQHWDYAASHNFDYFQGQITKYVTRWKKKNGLQDLEKAQHFLEKYIELEKMKIKNQAVQEYTTSIKEGPKPFGQSIIQDPKYQEAQNKRTEEARDSLDFGNPYRFAQDN